MNRTVISFGALTTAFSATSAEQNLFDATTVTYILSGIPETYIPIKLKINWGDGVIDEFDNTIYKKYRTESIFNEILYGKFSSIFSNRYAHTYYPSTSARFKSLSSEILIEYTNGERVSIIQPFKIISQDYHESIKDGKLIHTNLLPLSTNTIQHIISVEEKGYVIELEI